MDLFFSSSDFSTVYKALQGPNPADEAQIKGLSCDYLLQNY